MKSMKKLVTLLFSLVMLCALAMPVMADETYNITINGAKDHEYTAYQVFKGVYSLDNGKEYLSDVEWGGDVNGENIINDLKASEILGTHFTDETPTAEQVAYILQGFSNNSAEMDEFARIVGKNLKTNVAGKSSGVVGEDKNATISGLTAGYYFVKDTGTINAGEIATKFLVKVVGNAEITVKAQAPTLKKEIVKENGFTDNHTSANVGDKITFKLTANVPDMASFDKYTFTMHDTLSEGLTFDKDSVEVKINNTPLNVSNGYTLTLPTDTDNTFTIKFTKEQLGQNVVHGTGATIVVKYTATLNEKALKKDVETNKAYLEYTNNPSGDSMGEPGKTPEVPVYVYDFDLTVDKFDGTKNETVNEDSKRLNGATFILYKAKGAKKLYYVQDTTTKAVIWTETKDNATKFTTDANGKATFKGLEEGTYYLEETKAPEGYNKLKDSVEVKIKATYNEDGTLKTDVEGCKLQQDATNNGHYYQVQSIANKAGALLPSTGGIGTTIFYVLGSIMALGAAVLLIAKKRLNGQDR